MRQPLVHQPLLAPGQRLANLKAEAAVANRGDAPGHQGAIEPGRPVGAHLGVEVERREHPHRQLAAALPVVGQRPLLEVVGDRPMVGVEALDDAGPP